jgi:two-component system sensor histidine kinase PilS (NtrC family)
MESKNTVNSLEARFESALFFHSVVLFFIVCLVSIGIDSVVFEGAQGHPSGILFLLGILCFVSALVSLTRQVPEAVMALILVADLIILWVLARATGGSASPLLFTFPLVALVASTLFNQRAALVLLGLTLVFQTASIGFLPSAITSVFATMGTASLGLYLVRTLSRSNTALRISEVSRKRLENLQRAILTHIPSGLISIDNQKQVILCNGIGLKILGYTEDQLHLKFIDHLFRDFSQRIGDIRTMRTDFGNSGKRGDDRPLLLYTNPKGQELKLGYSVAPLSDIETGESLGALIVFQDLTEIIKLEENLRMTEKLAAIGKLAAGIAHEIRNPLAGISGSAQLLIGHPNLSDEDNKLLSIIQKESTRLDTLITEFLDYVRPPQPKIEALDIGPIVKHVCESLEVNTKWKKLSARIEVENISPFDSKILIDSNKVTQVLMNLIINAGQAGATRVCLKWESQKNALSVIDNGKGISLDNQKRLFEPFFTTKEGGTGLGLATSFRALDAMGARITVTSPISFFETSQDSSPIGGTMFTIIFKAA